MKKNGIILRRATEEDFDFILRVNEENVEVLSPMDVEKLKKFAESTELLLVADVDGKLAGFMVCLREGLDFYKSENYLWFSERYPQFLYIDRIVIDEPYRGIGLGRNMYQAVFEYGKEKGIDHVLAEIDTIPYNAASLKFHEIMGFTEVGEQFVRNNTIKVSLQAAKIL